MWGLASFRFQAKPTEMSLVETRRKYLQRWMGRMTVTKVVYLQVWVAQVSRIRTRSGIQKQSRPG
jgi:hypothetical protein